MQCCRRSTRQRMPGPTSKRALFGSPLTNLRPPSPSRPDARSRRSRACRFARVTFVNTRAVERTRPGQGLSDDEHGHDRGVERRVRVTKESNPVQHCVIDALCCRLVELLVVAAKQCPVECTWIEACQVTLTVI